MKVEARLNYNELNKIGNVVYNRADELESALESILNLIETIPEYWDGIDARNFISNTTTYIKNTKINAREIKNIGILIKNISLKYRNLDTSWEQTIKKVVIQE